MKTTWIINIYFQAFYLLLPGPSCNPTVQEWINFHPKYYTFSKPANYVSQFTVFMGKLLTIYQIVVNLLSIYLIKGEIVINLPNC